MANSPTSTDDWDSAGHEADYRGWVMARKMAGPAADHTIFADAADYSVL
jgi:hypothetical protein